MEITTVVGTREHLDFGEQGNIAIYFREQGNEVLKLDDHFREWRTSEIKIS